MLSGGNPLLDEVSPLVSEVRQDPGLRLWPMQVLSVRILCSTTEQNHEHQADFFFLTLLFQEWKI